MRSKTLYYPLFPLLTGALWGCGPKPQVNADTCDNNTANAGEVCFEAPPVLASPVPLFDAIFVDIDGDTVKDIAAAGGEGSVIVFRGSPNGGFSSFDAGSGRLIAGSSDSIARRLFETDIQQDGITDLVVLIEEPGDSGQIAVLLGVGSGSFLPALSSPLSAAPIDGVLVDNAITGNQDIIVLQRGALELRQGDGGGIFANPRVQGIASQEPREFIQTNLNADLFDDFLVADAFSAATKLLGSQDGVFIDGGITSIPPSNEIDLSELTGDSFDDAVAAGAGAGSLFVLRGLGSGDFEPLLTLFVGDEPRDTTLSDLDGDGLSDVIVAGGATLSFERGLGAGFFQESTPLWSGAGLRRLLIADVTFDRVSDVIVVGALGVSVLPGQLGTFPRGVPAPLGKERPKAAVLADLDNDQDQDLVLSINAGAAILKNNGSGVFNFAAPIVIPLDPTPVALVAADVDADNDLDVITLDPPNLIDPNGDATGRILVNDAGVFTVQNVLPISNLPPGTRELLVLDTNNDGRTELITVGQAPAIFTSDGDSFVQQLDLGVGAAISAALADLNGDGDQDVVFGQDNALVIRLGPDFTQESALSTDAFASVLASSDFDGDGDLDLAVLDASTEEVLVFPNEGGLSFGAPLRQTAPPGAQGLGVADSDADQVDDLLVVGADITQPFSLKNGSSLLALSVRGASALALGGAPGVLPASDLDLDGTVDLVFAARERGVIVSRQKR